MLIFSPKNSIFLDPSAIIVIFLKTILPMIMNLTMFELNYHDSMNGQFGSQRIRYDVMISIHFMERNENFKQHIYWITKHSPYLPVFMIAKNWATQNNLNWRCDPDTNHCRKPILVGVCSLQYYTCQNKKILDNPHSAIHSITCNFCA